jgi:colanic acid/amylovoran biosynthesis glycosyltransferase
MRILVFVDVFCGPTMTFLHRQVVDLARRHTVVVCCRRRDNEKYFPYDKVFEIRRSYWERLVRLFLRRFALGFTVRSGALDSEIGALIDEFEIDVVLSHFIPNALEINAVVQSKRLAHYVIVHGYDGSSLLRERTYRREVTRATGLKYICASKSMEANLRVEAGVRADFVVPLGIPAGFAGGRDGRCAPKHSRRFFFQAANFVEKKGHNFTIAAFAIFAKNNSDVDLLFAGSGPLLLAARRQAEALGVGHRVHFLGHCDQTTVMDNMERCIAFVHHSVTASNGDQESIPTCVMEAMALGAVVISTLHSGIPEVVEDGNTGFLVAERDVRSYADRLSLVADMPAAERSQYGQKAKIRVLEQFNFSIQLEKIESILRVSNEDRIPLSHR